MTAAAVAASQPVASPSPRGAARQAETDARDLSLTSGVFDTAPEATDAVTAALGERVHQCDIVPSRHPPLPQSEEILD